MGKQKRAEAEVTIGRHTSWKKSRAAEGLKAYVVPRLVAYGRVLEMAGFKPGRRARVIVDGYGELRISLIREPRVSKPVDSSTPDEQGAAESDDQASAGTSGPGSDPEAP